MLDGNRESCFVDIFYYSLTPVSSIFHRPKHEATRYERAEGLSTSIKNPKEARRFHWLRNQRAFFFMLTCSDFLERLFF